MRHIFPDDRHFLDPSGGYDGDPVTDDRRAGYRRVQVGAILMAIDALAEAGLNMFRDIPVVWVWAIIVAAGALGFGTVARKAQHHVSPSMPYASSRLVESFVVFALLMSNAANYIGAISVGGDRIPIGYPMVFLACAVFFTIPTRRFVVIGSMSYAVFAAWIIALDMPVMVKVFPMFNAALSVIAGCFGRAGIERIQQVGVRQRARIVAQNQALQDANAALSDRNTELNDLMAVAAHDLRSPLFGLRGVLELARERQPATPQAWDRLLDAATRSVGAMVQLVTRLLDVHEADVGNELALGPKDPNVLLSAAIARMTPVADAAGIRIERTGAMVTGRLLGHGDSIGQILDNLIGNAIRFSPSGNVVEVGIALTTGHVWLEVADRGVGIPEGERDMLFAKFRRGAIPPPNGTRGSGLGLYIAATLARRMQARCEYRPRSGGGSVFLVGFRPAGQATGASSVQTG